MMRGSIYGRQYWAVRISDGSLVRYRGVAAHTRRKFDCRMRDELGFVFYRLINTLKAEGLMNQGVTIIRR